MLGIFKTVASESIIDKYLVNHLFVHQGESISMKKFSFLGLLSFVSSSVLNTIYYDLLGLPANATQEQIDNDRSKLQFDRIPKGLWDVGECLNKVLENVRDVLKDPVKREEYDRNGPKIEVDVQRFLHFQSDIVLSITFEMNTKQDSRLQVQLKEWKTALSTQPT